MIADRRRTTESNARAGYRVSDCRSCLSGPHVGGVLPLSLVILGRTSTARRECPRGRRTGTIRRRRPARPSSWSGPAPARRTGRGCFVSHREPLPQHSCADCRVTPVASPILLLLVRAELADLQHEFVKPPARGQGTATVTQERRTPDRDRPGVGCERWMSVRGNAGHERLDRDLPLGVVVGQRDGPGRRRRRSVGLGHIGRVGAVQDEVGGGAAS